MPENTDAIKTIYEQVCSAHNEISEFRAKLLALLPIASGTGIFLLLSEKVATEATTHLIAVGMFGGLITLGLFLYELRGIHRCHALRECGKTLEKGLMQESCTGVFTSEQASVLKGFVGVTWAALIIYPTLIGAWSYVASVGFFGYGASFRIEFITSVGVTLFFMVGGKIVINLQGRQLHSS
ncbi:MAG: hypothetical protein AAB354_12270 [candidate division KSB1 bacterium]